MKKILIASNMLLLGIIFFISCNQSKNDPLVNNNTCPSKTCDFYLRSEGSIPGTVDGHIINQMSLAYQRDAAKSMVGFALNAATSDTDALSVCFDLEKIKSLICHMEGAVCSKGCDTAKLGIRFYYIKYDPTIQNLPDGLRELVNAEQNKHSLVMVPAYMSHGIWYDFDYSDVKPGCNLKPDTNTHYIKGVTNFMDGSNHGGIGPPPEPGTFPTIEN